MAPDHQRENLIGIGLIEIQERWAAATAFCPARAYHLAADGRRLPDMVFGFGCRQSFLSLCERSCQKGNSENRERRYSFADGLIRSYRDAVRSAKELRVRPAMEN